jgi:phenylacetate-coenzyme A ligase PaaK-like adenylate-forming protein
VRSACACGSRFARIQRIEGRLVDSINRTGGRLVSPYLLTEAIAGLKRYQIVQERLDSIVVRVDGEPDHQPTVEAQIIARARSVIPEATEVVVRWDERLDPLAGSKLRVVECRMPS